VNNTGSLNTAVGVNALGRNGAGTQNTATGASVLLSNTTGNSNTAMGHHALLSNDTGGNNTAIGVGALGANTSGGVNTALGYGAGANVTTGSDNIAIGVGAGSNITTASDTICIGIPGVDVTDGCYIGHVFQEVLDPDHLTMAIDVNGKVGTPASSRRFKDDIKPMDRASEVILSLKPVTFHYKNDPTCSPRFGLIAEEVAAVDPTLVACDKQGKPYSVRYDQVNAMLLNEFLKEHRKVEKLETTVAEQQKSFQSKLADQQKQIEALSAGLQKVSAQLEIGKPSPQMATKNR
jgi:hypothetical protein